MIDCVRCIGLAEVGNHSCMQRVSGVYHPRISKIQPRGVELAYGDCFMVGLLVYYSCPMRGEVRPS